MGCGMTNPTATNAHLYPFTLAFDEGLKQGTIDLATASVFVDRVFDAWLEAKVRINPHALKEATTAQAYAALQDEE